MSEEKKPVAWITKNGKHIPIYDDVTEEEQRKKKQIEQNESEAESLNTDSKYAEFGQPGIYKLYRTGKVDFGKKNYRISFAEDEKYADTYTGSHGGMPVKSYEVEIRKPLVIELKADKTHSWDEKQTPGYLNDEQAGTMAAYNKLYGTNYSSKDVSTYYHGAFFDFAKLGSTKARKMLRQRDQEIMDEAVRQGYDAVIYKFDYPETISSGVVRSKPLSKNEVLIPSEYKKRIRESK